jgi:hypothetical protein
MQFAWTSPEHSQTDFYDQEEGKEGCGLCNWLFLVDGTAYQERGEEKRFRNKVNRVV